MMTENDVNIVTARGYKHAVTLYEQSRLSYPNEMIDLIKSFYNKPNITIDLGAEIIAIEPISATHENLKNIPLITKIINGTAEHIPFEDNTIDIILCG
ncbi:unnamed protein product [Rotaria sordida]|uniref:Methyltransferase type 11 domain-containing protein n=1 Tax=Rotaria sordida TaxID=392033 RepID=A0A815HUY1_9BILA|nr:unnamed protein product [Rotaria sordida]